MYVAIGYLALQAGIGGGSEERASSGGVFVHLRSLPLGEFVLGVLAGGLLAYAVWNGVRATWGDPASGSGGRQRATYAIRCVLYLAVAVSAVATLVGAGGGSGEGSERAAGFLLGLPGGAWITAGIGIAIGAHGVRQLVRNAVEAEFMERLSPDRFTDERLVRRVGRIGYAARGVTLVVIGGFFVVAGLKHDADAATGLGGALDTLSRQPYGPGLLLVVAAGLLLFGLYVLAESRMRRVT
jgi:hypothetical protein